MRLPRRLPGMHVCWLLVMLAVTACQGQTRPAPPSPATPTPAAAPESAIPNQGISARDVLWVPVFADDLVPGWTLSNSWDITYAAESAARHSGAQALRFVATGDKGALFFSVAPGSPAQYERRDFLAIRFFIRAADGKEIGLNELAVAVTTSDKQPYWSADDQSVPQQDVPFTGETRLAYLGFSQPLPANTWTPVQVWLPRLQGAARYITGFYIKTSAGGGSASGGQAAHRTYYIDDAGLVAIAEDNPPAPVQAGSPTLTTVTIAFNKELDPTSAANPQNYRISSREDPAYQSPQAPVTAELDPSGDAVRLTAAARLKAGAAYSVTVAGVADRSPRRNMPDKPHSIAFTASKQGVQVDITTGKHAISPLIYGVSGASKDYLQALHLTLNNWGGNPSSRYNWELGNAWNSARDWQYRNGNYGYQGQSASDDFVAESLSAGADVRISLPTLGWVAKNADNNTCSFPQADGACGDADGASCDKPGAIADPNRANVPTNVDWVVRWVQHLRQPDKQFRLRLLAMDNEPDVWGTTHYDVHPQCTTYEEILTRYLEYATAVRAVAPEAELLGPVSCCWQFYWNSAAGKGDKLAHGNSDFLPWFLQEVRKHDVQTGVRTLDVLDIHYYPAGLYNDNIDPKMAATRLRSSRSLWDKTYVDESWIGQPVYLIPRMKQWIADYYPGTRFGISEWNWGAEKTINGALAIADVLGILGREDVYFASYWRYTPHGSPGYYAFAMYTNYDGQGGRFGDVSVQVTSANPDQVAAYASLESSTGRLLVMLINKDPSNEVQVPLEFVGFTPNGSGAVYRYAPTNLDHIVSSSLEPGGAAGMTLPPYSITLLVLDL